MSGKRPHVDKSAPDAAKAAELAEIEREIQAGAVRWLAELEAQRQLRRRTN